MQYGVKDRMPSPVEHDKLSKARTGKSFIELHEWMDEEYNCPDIPKRHDITKIPKNLENVKEKFGDGSIEEFLHHIKEDYEENKVYKAIKILSNLKNFLLSPINQLRK